MTPLSQKLIHGDMLSASEVAQIARGELDGVTLWDHDLDLDEYGFFEDQILKPDDSDDFFRVRVRSDADGTAHDDHQTPQIAERVMERQVTSVQWVMK